jgi:integral membrane protein 2B
MAKFRNDISNQYFREEFELDLSDDESYSKITVPDFRDGREGRFLHDFNFNQSSIIDMNKNRCFVMPLDRETVLQPHSLFDLITKMYSGYYNIDTTVVRQDYRVVTPAISDITLVSDRIANECRGMNIYMLERYVQGVYKRSIAEALPNSGKFAEFSGNKIVQFDIVNIHELDEFEKH